MRTGLRTHVSHYAVGGGGEAQTPIETRVDAKEQAASGLVVAGVGRSGTSIATQLAASLGLSVPSGADLMPPNHANPTGYWESTSLSRINDDLLRRWASNWWQPPGVVNDDMIDAVAELVGPATTAFFAAFPNRPWVWKDPRLTVLLPFWDRILGRQPVLFPHRDPRAVAHSVAVRDGVPPLSGLAIWERHTRLALAALGGHQVAVVSYDRLCRDPRIWRSDLVAFCSDAGLPVHEPVSSAEDMVAPRGGHSAGPIHLSAAQESLYEIVRSLEGFHTDFPGVDLPVEDELVAMRLAAIRIPTWTFETIATSGLGAAAEAVMAERAAIMADHERIVEERTRLLAEHAAAHKESTRLAGEVARLDADARRHTIELERARDERDRAWIRLLEAEQELARSSRRSEASLERL